MLVSDAQDIKWTKNLCFGLDFIYDLRFGLVHKNVLQINKCTNSILSFQYNILNAHVNTTKTNLHIINITHNNPEIRRSWWNLKQQQ